MNERPNFELNGNPEYNETIGKLIPDDPGDAEIFNRVFSEALNNTHYTKQQLDKVKTTADGALPASQKGAAGGVASLDSKGKLAQMPTAEDVGAVPVSRRINEKPLSADITLTKADIGLGNADNTADSLKRVSHANTAGSAGTVPWSGITGKPAAFPAAAHMHDDRYYTEGETNTRLDAKANEAEHHIHTYTSLSQLGLSGSVTMAQICEALPDVSELLIWYGVSSSSVLITDAPMDYCTITVKKNNLNYACCIAYSSGAAIEEWTAYHYRRGFSGWKKRALIESGRWTPVGVGCTVVPAKAIYTVVGNLCFVHFRGTLQKGQGTDILYMTGLPYPTYLNSQSPITPGVYRNGLPEGGKLMGSLERDRIYLRYTDSVGRDTVLTNAVMTKDTAESFSFSATYII